MKYGLFLQNPKAKCSGIKIIATYKGKRYTKALGYSIPTLIWDKTNQKIKYTPKLSQFRDAAMAVVDIRAALDRVAFKNPEITSSKYFWEIVECERYGRPYAITVAESRELVAYFREVYIPRYKWSKSPSRIVRLKVVLKFLTEWELETNTKWTFEAIGAKFYIEMRQFCAQRGYATSYYNNLISVIKQVIKESIEVDKYHTNNDYKQSTALREVSDFVYLNLDELRAIQNLDINEALVKDLHPNTNIFGIRSKVKSYKLARDLFLIGAHTGLRVSDFKRLRPENITKDNKISIVTVKTGDRVIVPINSVVRGILDSGLDLERPTLSDQRIRAYIKIIAKCAGIKDVIEVRKSKMTGLEVVRREKWELISTHTARRSFATNAYKSGVKTLQIMQITEHKKESTFMRYIRITADENADLLASHPLFE